MSVLQKLPLLPFAVQGRKNLKKIPALPIFENESVAKFVALIANKMELDHIKDIWTNEKVSEIPKISLEKQKQLHLPLEKIRKNMRMEFWSTVVLFIFIILFLIFKDMHFFRFKVYIITLIFSMMLITTFYFFKFFNLYKNISNSNLTTKDSLKDLNYQCKLNEQYYLSFYISFIPFVICELLLIFDYMPSLKDFSGTKFIIFFLSFCIIMLGCLFAVGKWWFQKYYGKYMKQIEQIIENLR